jgi:regulator of nonsense transcripts 1
MRRYEHQFNRDYTIDMILASEVESAVRSSSTEIYYVAFEIQPQLEDSDLEQTLQLPDVGTPVRITPKGRDTKQSNKPVWPWPEPKVAKSSRGQPSPSRERIAAMSRKPQQYYSSGGPSSQHTAVARQGQSSPDSSHFRKTSKTLVWHGQVISSSLADIKSLGAPINLAFAKIYKPHDEVSRGRVINMTARVTFGQSNIPQVAARKAIQDVMWGNECLGISRFNKMKALLLAHENHVNHVMKFLPPDNDNLDDTAIPSFLNWLKDSRNSLQKRAIREALNHYGSFMKLITGPPGTGKTAVSTAIIRYCYVTETPILLICGQNQGLDLKVNVAPRN